MKLYIKANNLKILKNIDKLLPYAISKTTPLIDEQSNFDYVANIKGAKFLDRYKEELFYDNRELKRLLKGIYFGNSSCEHLLPSVQEVLKAKEICKKRYLNFVFVLPPLSSFKMDDARYILENLLEERAEVVVNDFGALNMALELKHIKPILGINFLKVIKNAFIDSIKPDDISPKQLQNQQELNKRVEFENKSVREFYKSLGISRFSIENNSIELSFLREKPYMQVDFYYPHITLSHSKACDIAGFFDDKRGYFVQDNCSKYCNLASLEFKDSRVLGLRQRYNTLYKTNFSLDLPKELISSAKNRLVWEMFV